MKLIIGCPVAERAWILPAWLEAIEEQHIECEVVCVYSDSTDSTEAILRDWGATLLYDGRPARPPLEIDNHAWGSEEKYEYMASMRNRLVEYCLDADADYFFSLDSDILLHRNNTLKMLLDFASTHIGVTSPAVNMSFRDTCWNTMSWVDPYVPNRVIRPTKHPEGGQVDVVMAAMLLDRKGLEARWSSHHQGEDVGFCIDAREKKIPLWWLKGLHVQHVMRKN